MTRAQYQFNLLVSTCLMSLGIWVHTFASVGTVLVGFSLALLGLTLAQRYLARSAKPAQGSPTQAGLSPVRGP